MVAIIYMNSNVIVKKTILLHFVCFFYLFYLFQPFDIGCFNVLKRLYDKEVENFI